jgi:hypothetical protein
LKVGAQIGELGQGFVFEGQFNPAREKGLVDSLKE